MIDAVMIDDASAAPGGVSGRMGAFWLHLHTSGRDAERILAHTGPVRVDTQMEFDVTSGELTLYGFASPEGKVLYQALRGVKGIGAQTAMAVLDAGEPVDVLRAVAASDVRFLTRVPGLGPARAKLLVAALRDRYGAVLPQPLPVDTAAWVEARETLISGGMDESGAEDALHAAAARGATTAAALVRGAGAIT